MYLFTRILFLSFVNALMIIGSSKSKPEDIVWDMKKHTSLELRAKVKTIILKAERRDNLDDGKSREEKW